MIEKKIEQKFKADFRELFPKLKDATVVPVVAFPKDSSEVDKMVDMRRTPRGRCGILSLLLLKEDIPMEGGRTACTSSQSISLSKRSS